MTVTLTPLPFEEAKAFWAAKVILRPGQFNRLSAEAKVKAFAVGGIAKGDELATVYNALRKAIDDGTPFSEFKAECAAIFDRRGWTGERAWRVDNIFRTNIQTAYNVGRYQQLAEDVELFPYWQYDAVNDSRTRPTHLAMNGRVWPANHPVWDQWYPPNGFRCRCSVTPLTRGQAERRGLTVEHDDPTNKPIFPVAPRTGLTSTVPVQLLPDPGFAYHPGKAVYGGLVDQAMAEGPVLKQLPGLLGAADYRLPDAVNLKGLSPAPDLLPSLADLKQAGMSNSQAAAYYRDEFRKAFDLVAGGERVVEVAGDPVIVSERLITGKGGRAKLTKGDRGQYLPLYQETLTDPDEVWLTPMRGDTGKMVLRRRQLRYWRGDGENVAGFAVLDIEDGVWNGVTVYDVAAGQEAWAGGTLLDNGESGYRRGVLLYKKARGRN